MSAPGVVAFDRRALFGYGILGLPLAMAALPIYVHVPKLYGGTLGIDLAVVGFVLLALRLFDGIVDPLIGAWNDRHGDRVRPIAWSLPLLAVGMIALFAPAVGSTGARVAWLCVTLAIVQLAYSVATINHSAWGAELSDDPHQRTRITATREGLALVGVLLAASIPGVVVFAAPAIAGNAGGLEALTWIFAVLLVVCGGWTLIRAPRPSHVMPTRNVREAIRGVVRVREFRGLLAVFLVNGIAAAIPGTLVLFFIDDVIGAPQYQGAFLATYFLSAAVAMPLWISLARTLGKSRAWLLSMALAIIAFVWAAGLGKGEVGAFFVICAASGIALSADLALPPSLLADAIGRGPQEIGAGTYFGIWTMASKLNLALAAGIALPLVEWLGYRPGVVDGAGSSALAIVYAGVPCALKVIAAVLAWRLLVAPRISAMPIPRTQSGDM